MWCSEARKSLNRPDSKKVLSYLIYNYKPTYCGYAGYSHSDNLYIILSSSSPSFFFFTVSLNDSLDRIKWWILQEWLRRGLHLHTTTIPSLITSTSRVYSEYASSTLLLSVNLL